MGKINKRISLVALTIASFFTFGGANAQTLTSSASTAATNFGNGATNAASNFFGGNTSQQGGGIINSGSLPSGLGVVNTNAGISFAPAYNSQNTADTNYLTSQGCDPAVYNSLYQRWATETQMTINNSRSGGVMQQYINGAPSAQQASACLSGVMGQINGIAKTASAILAFMNGSTDWAAMGENVTNSAMSQACSAVNNLSGQFATNSLSPVTGAIGQGTGMVNSVGNVTTPLGTLNTNVGNMILNQSQSSANSTPPLLK